MEKITLSHDEQKGEVFLDENSVIILSRGNLAHLQKDFERVMGPVATSIVYNSGRDYAQNVQSNIKQSIIKLIAKISKDMIAKKMLDVFSSWGYGKAEFLELDPEKSYAKLKVTNSANALSYENSTKPVCHFIRGILAGAGTIIMEKEMHCLESKCVAKGDEYCEFEIITKEELEKRKLLR